MENGVGEHPNFRTHYFSATKVSARSRKHNGLLGNSPRGALTSTNTPIVRTRNSSRPSTAQIIRPMGMDVFMKSTRKVEQLPDNARQVAPTTPLRNYDRTTTSEFISTYTRNKMSLEAAEKIKRCWKAYRTKKKWLLSLDKVISAKKNLKKYCFVGWFGVATKNHDRIIETYKRFNDLSVANSLNSNFRKISPFGLFYTTGIWYQPDELNPRQFQYLVRVLGHTEMRHVFSIWRSVATSQRAYRSASVSFRQTVRKRVAFGFISVGFHMWHRYAQWKKQSSRRQDCFKLDVSEYIIDWHVREVLLNQKKARQMRAEQQYLASLKRRGRLALYQRYIDQRQKASDLEASAQFYLRRLQDLARRAWNKYIEIQKAKRSEILRIKKRWYTLSYKRARTEAYTDALGKFHLSMTKYSVFKHWQKHTQRMKLFEMSAAYKIQSYPAIALDAVFKMEGIYEFAFFGQVWREWINYTRRRRLWKKFGVKNSSTNSDREDKLRFLFAMKRSSEQKMARRMFHFSTRFFPGHLPYCYETMERDLNYFRYKVREHRVPEKPKESSFNLDLFRRAVLIAINEVRPFDKATIRRKITHQKSDERLERKLPLEEIITLYNDNMKEMKQMFQNKMRRDITVLYGIISHMAAIELHKTVEAFSIRLDEPHSKEVETSCPHLNLYLPDGVPYSIRLIISELDKKPIPIPQQIIQKLKSDKTLFEQHMRQPSIIYGTQEDTQQEVGKAVEQQVLNTKARVYIDQYKRSSSAELSSPERPLTPSKELFAKEQGSLLFEYLEPKLEKADFHNALRRFFLSMIDVRIDPSKSPESSNIPTSSRHNLRRHIAVLKAGVCGFDTSLSVPMKVNAPAWVNQAVSAILSTHAELKRHSSLSTYLDDIPFATKLDVNSDEANGLRTAVFSTITKKFPKLTKDASLRRPTPESDDFCHLDAIAACFLLPYLFKIDMLGDFLRDEIKIDQMKHE